MKKTNAKLLSIVFAIVAVVATFVMFEIPAFAEDVENEIATIETETVENEENIEVEAELTLDLDIDFEEECEFELETADDIHSCYGVETVEAEIINPEVEIEVEETEETEEIIICEDGEIEEEKQEEIVEKQEETVEEKAPVVIEQVKVVETVEVEELVEETVETEVTEEAEVVTEQTETVEINTEEIKQQVIEEINNCESKLVVEKANGFFAEIKAEIDEIAQVYITLVDYRIGWVQDADTFLVNEKRAIIL